MYVSCVCVRHLQVICLCTAAWPCSAARVCIPLCTTCKHAERKCNCTLVNFASSHVCLVSLCAAPASDLFVHSGVAIYSVCRFVQTSKVYGIAIGGVNYGDLGRSLCTHPLTPPYLYIVVMSQNNSNHDLVKVEPNTWPRTLFSC